MVVQAAVWRGSAGDSCGSFLAASAGHPPAKSQTMIWRGDTYYDKSHGYSEWIQGYLTAVSAEMNISTLDAIDYAGIDLWLRKWCGKHPTENLLSAIRALVEEKSKAQ